MKQSIKELALLLIFLGVSTITFAQTYIKNADYDVTDDVIKIEEYIYEESEISSDQTVKKSVLRGKNFYQFKNGLLQLSKIQSDVAKNIVQHNTYTHTIPHKEYNEHFILTKNGNKDNEAKATYKAYQFKGLTFFFNTDDFKTLENTDQKLEVDYNTRSERVRQTITSKENNLIESYVNTSFGPTNNTYNTKGEKVKEFYPGLFGYDNTYNTEGFLYTKTQFGTSISELVTNYYYEKDTKGNWINKLEITFDKKYGKTKIKLTTRKLTYNNDTTSGSMTFNQAFVEMEYAKYMLLDKPSISKKSGCISGDCQNGFGKFVYDNGEVYEGNFKNGVRNGKGTYVYTNGGKYIGDWFNAKPHGKGTYLNINGNKLIANFSNGKLNGEGTLYDYKNGEKRVDLYKEDKVVKTISTTPITKTTTTDNGLKAPSAFLGKYYYKKDKEDRFWLYDPDNNSIAKKSVHLAYVNSDYYMYEPATKNVLKLVNYSKSSVDEPHPVEVVMKEQENFIYIDHNEEMRIYCNNKMINFSDIKLITPNGKKYIMTPKGTKDTYWFILDPEKPKTGISKLNKLPSNADNAYWGKVFSKDERLKTDIIIIVDGEQPKTENFEILSSDGSLLFSIGSKYYHVPYKASKVMDLHSLIPIPKTEFDQLKSGKKSSSLDKKNATNTVVSSQIDTNTLIKEYTTRKTSGTYNAVFEEKVITNLNTLGRNDIEALFNVLLDINDGLKLAPKLDADVKTKLKAYSQKKVDDYAKIHDNNVPKSLQKHVKKSTGCITGNCENGTGTYIWESGTKYSGQWVNGKKHGTGTVWYKSGSIYKGDWENDERNGKGVFTWANGDSYTGEYYENRMSGKGVYVWKSGSKYDGNWLNGNKHGYGKEYDAKGTLLFEGEFKNDKRFKSKNE